jgi:hypothetical protein
VGTVIVRKTRPRRDPPEKTSKFGLKRQMGPIIVMQCIHFPVGYKSLVA